MAIYTDSQLVERVRAVLYSNGSKDIDAIELRDLLLDFVDSKLNQSASFGVPEHGTIDADDLVDGGTTITYAALVTDFPIIFIKSPGVDGDIWSSIHYNFGPLTSGSAWIHFEEDLAAGTSVEYIVVKFA